MKPKSYRAPPPGLCGSCIHSRVVTSLRGSVFRLCEAAKRDPRLRKYPSLPVLSCHAWTPRDADRDATS